MNQVRLRIDLLPFFISSIFIAGIAGCTKPTEDEPRLFSDVDTVAFRKGETVYPFAYINPKEKGWKVVIEISGDDLNGLSEKISGKKLSTTKPQVLKRIKKWPFRYEGGDLATVTSSILVYKNGTLVDQQGIVLDKKLVGLQSIKYGWIEPKEQDEIYATIRLMEERSF